MYGRVIAIAQWLCLVVGHRRGIWGCLVGHFGGCIAWHFSFDCHGFVAAVHRRYVADHCHRSVGQRLCWCRIRRFYPRYFDSNAWHQFRIGHGH